MKLIPTLLCAALAAAAVRASAQEIEALKLNGEQAFGSTPAPLSLPGVFRRHHPAPAPEQNDSVLQNPAVRPIGALGNAVGRVKLAAQLDKHRDLLTLKLGPSTWDVGIAGDASFKKYFLTFRQGERLIIAPVGDIKRLRNEGVDVTIEPGVVYHFHLTVGSIFNDPVHNSTLEITHKTPGADYKLSTGELLDKIKAKAFVFNAGDNEYWMLDGTDVDPNTNKLLDTHSYLFFHEAGLSSKAWPVAEKSVPVGQPTGVTFGDQSVGLQRTADGDLVVSAD